MKQKQVKALPKGKKTGKLPKKLEPVKKIDEAEDSSDEEEDEEEMGVESDDDGGENGVGKIKEEDEDDEGEDDDDDDDEDEEESDEEGVGEEAESEEDDDEDVGQSDDDEPAERAIGKQEPTIPSKIKTGDIPPNFPQDRVVHVSKLPKKVKQIDVVEVFAKYGPIHTIHIQPGPAGGTADIAFKTAKAAKAALAANDEATMKGSKIQVSLKKGPAKEAKVAAKKEYVKPNKEKVVYVKYLKRDTTEDQVKKHFSACGEIENVAVIVKQGVTFAFVTFAEKAAVQEAKKLHNTILNGGNIGVFQNGDDASDHSKHDPKLTVTLKNKQHLENVAEDKIRAIFAKCGEIECIDILCRKHCLAFVTFKDSKSVEKAMKHNGKTIQGIEVEIEAFNPDRSKSAIFVTNIKPGVQESELRNLFEKCGEIEFINQRPGHAIIQFKDSEAFCKSFLLNETKIKGQMIFIEPFSVHKTMSMNKRKLMKPMGQKRPWQNQNNGFPGNKRIKAN